MNKLEKILLTGFAVGCASPIYDSAEDAPFVTIEPLNPLDNDNLIGYVDLETKFQYYWLKNGQLYQTDCGIKTNLSHKYTSVDDIWTLQAWVPESAYSDSYFFGSTEVEINY